MSIRDLGERLKCKKCNKFGNVTKLVLDPKNREVQLSLFCQSCGRSLADTFTSSEFEKLANNLLIDQEWIVDYQRKVLFHFQKYVKLKGGMEGVWAIRNPDLLKKSGKELFLCKCGDLFQWKLGKFIFKKKAAYAEILQHCRCGKDAKRLIEIPIVRELFTSGLIDSEFIKHFEEQLAYELEEYDAKEGYGLTASILAPYAQEALGMATREGETEKKCPYCSAVVNKFSAQCPVCGNDLSF